MRIPSTKIWLATALTLGTGGASGDSQPALTFRDEDFTQNFGSYNGTSVLAMRISQPQVARTFSWTPNRDNLVIRRVNLYALNETAGKGKPIGEGLVTDSAATLPQLTTVNPETTKSPVANIPQVDHNPSQGKIELDVQEGSVTINDVTQLTRYRPSPLYFGVVWLGKTDGMDESGETFSRAFAVAQTMDEAELIVQESGFRYRNDSAVFNEKIPADSNSTPSTGQAPGTNGAPNSTPTSSQEASPIGKENEAGLATGPIIGIAVGCGLLGLLLVLGGIWFLIRRRNKQAGNAHLGSPGRPYGAERSRTDDLIAEKEASAGGADPSPHSPYSDDGVVLVPSVGHASSYHNSGPNGGVVMGTPVAAPVLPQQIPQVPHQDHHQQAGPYPTYSDRGSIGGMGGGGGSPSTHAASITHSTHDDINRAAMGSPTAGRATPHSSLAPQYAHLVEEGMTEDEIRRLEDEERQLDAEIERAGRR